MMKKKKKSLTVSLKRKEANNLYRPNGTHKQESFDEIEIKRGFRFDMAPVLLKEWFFLLKPGGRLVLSYTSDGKEPERTLEKTVWWLFHGNYDIVSHVFTKRKGMLIIKKKSTQFQPDDSIEKWTIGIITNGERDDWMEEIISSIKKLNIPKFEIIVCGKYKERSEKNFIYIPFNERAERGWITKKKNLICERASYENVCIIHDRLVFDKNWFRGMMKYGNAFELLGCVQRDRETGGQAGDWLTHGGELNARYKISRLNYEDWDYNIYLSGQLTIFKRSIWKEVLWDETRYWGEEDVDLSFRARDLGYIIRFNPYSRLNAITWRHGKLPLRYRFSEGVLPKDMLMRRSMRIAARVFLLVPLLERLHASIYGIISRTKLYKHFIYH